MRKPLAAGVVAVLAATLLASPASAAQTIGYPSFGNSGSIPQPPVGYSTGNTMQAIYDAESGGTDFWVDRLLSRSGSDPSDPESCRKDCEYVQNNGLAIRPSCWVGMTSCDQLDTTCK